MDLKFTVITPSLNQGIYIRDTIETVLDQNYNNIEHIIIDGCSTDSTLQILKEYPQLIWISEPDRGAANAINKGIKMAKGEIISWLNSDDYYDKNVLRDIAEIFWKNKEIDFVYGNLTFVDENKKLIRIDKTEKYDIDYLIHKDPNIIRQPCTFFRKKLLDKVGLLDEELKCVFDYDLFLRMLRITNPYYINKNITFYRDYKNTLTRKYIRLQGSEIIKVARKNGAKITDKIILSSFIKKKLFPFLFY